MSTAEWSWRALFHPLPRQWGLRGDPVVWELLEESLANEPPPGDMPDVATRLREHFIRIVGVDLDTSTERTISRREFNRGGMSGGLVALPVWRERLVPMLLRRAAGQLGQ